MSTRALPIHLAVSLLAAILLSGCPQAGSEGGACYGNGTCDDTLSCVDDVCVALAPGTEGGPCYGNGTCNDGLVCEAATCRSATGDGDGDGDAGDGDGDGDTGDGDGDTGDGDGDTGDGDGDGDSVVTGPDPMVPEAVPATVADNPTAPLDDSAGAMGWTDAPLLDGVEVVSNFDSALLVLPVVSGAQDYRAFVLEPGVSVSDDGGREQVDGAVIYCAGYRQFNDEFTGNLELMRLLEVAGIDASSRVVVEALDRPCPFEGNLSQASRVIDMHNNEVPVSEQTEVVFSTEAEIRGRHGSLIVNGHGPGAVLGQPADADPPVVLARTTVILAPSDMSTPTAFFDGFDDDDPIAYVGSAPDSTDRAVNDQFNFLYQNSRWSFYAYNAIHAEPFIDRGMLHVNLADWEQAVFASHVAYPRQTVAVDDETYLHVTFEVASNATARRYWWISLCGSDNPGETMDDDGTLLGDIIQTPFFYQPDGLNPTLSLWNCLQVFPRDGEPFDLEPSDKRTQSDIRVMVNLANEPERDNVVNVSPDQYGLPFVSPSWFRTQDAAGNLTGPILDDQLLIAPRARFDMYIRRDRVILYVNGDLRLCNDFPTVPLTLAEGALGFGQVLYHSTAERLEFDFEFNDRRGQYYYRTNRPYLDVRTWDNLGYEEGVGAPASFNESSCYVYAP